MCHRHRTYSTEVTSKTSNLPLHRIIRPSATHRRFIRVPKNTLGVKSVFCVFHRNFQLNFVQYILLYITHLVGDLVGEAKKLGGTVGKALSRFRQAENTVGAVY